jgi:hypothetical protein
MKTPLPPLRVRGLGGCSFTLAGPDCTPHLQVGDGPSPSAAETRCIDMSMVTAFR